MSEKSYAKLMREADRRGHSSIQEYRESRHKSLVGPDLETDDQTNNVTLANTETEEITESKSLPQGTLIDSDEYVFSEEDEDLLGELEERLYSAMKFAPTPKELIERKSKTTLSFPLLDGIKSLYSWRKTGINSMFSKTEEGENPESQGMMEFKSEREFRAAVEILNYTFGAVVITDEQIQHEIDHFKIASEHSDHGFDISFALTVALNEKVIEDGEIVNWSGGFVIPTVPVRFTDETQLNEALRYILKMLSVDSELSKTDKKAIRNVKILLLLDKMFERTVGQKKEPAEFSAGAIK